MSEIKFPISSLSQTCSFHSLHLSEWYVILLALGVKILASHFIPHLVSHSVVSIFLKYTQTRTASRLLGSSQLSAGRRHRSRLSSSCSPSCPHGLCFTSAQLSFSQLKSDNIHSPNQTLGGLSQLEAQYRHPLKAPPQISTLPLPTLSPTGFWAALRSQLAVSASGPLHLLFLSPGMLSQVITCLILSLNSFLCSAVTL